MEEEKLDFSQFRGTKKENDISFFSGDTLGDKVENLLRDLVILPYGDIQFPIVTSFLTTPITVATTAGILFLWGASGTGKSQVATTGTQLYQMEPLTASSTFASIRNKIQQSRWYDPEFQENERNFILAWDDITPSKITGDENILSLLKCFNRKTSKITISSSTAGQNLIFDAFALKIISSIHPIWSIWELNELKRRIMPIWFKKVDNMTYDEKMGCDKSVDELMDIEELEIKPLASELEQFWRTIKNLASFKEVKTKIKNKKLPFSSNKFRVCLDVMTCHSVIYDCEIDETISVFESYWELVDEHILSVKSGTEQFLDRLISLEIAKNTKENRKLYMEGMPELMVEPTNIDPTVLKTALEEAKKNGMLDSQASIMEVNNLMKSRGYSLMMEGNKNIWKRLV